jgi:branched-chain amino acid transport system ATP-binding protein
MTDSLLTIADLDAGYGAVVVLDGVSLTVAAGSVTALLGSNGAGKTTLMRVLAGLIAPTRGRILFNGADIADWPSHRRVAEGLALVPEGRRVFPDMTVEENLRLGAITPRVRKSWPAGRDTAFAMFPRLQERRRQMAGSLSGGEQQMLAMARGLMSAPRLLLLDEPTLGLAPQIVELIFQSIIELRQRGCTILIAEQDVVGTLDIADTAYVLENGRIALSGPARSLAGDERIRTAYLGL